MNIPQPTWRVTAPLVALTAVPLLAGIVRLSGLSAGGPITPDNAHFFVSPAPVIIHIVASLFYCLLGALQFSQVRRNNITWHRIAGRMLVLMGLLSSLSGLWMTLFYGIPAALQGVLLYLARILVGAGMTYALILAWIKIRQKDVTAHRAWMIRAYALGQGAGTQVLIMLPPAILLGGDIAGMPRDILMSTAWVINLLFAEWIIRRQTGRSRKISLQSEVT
jgi:uncharacterized membrane protein YozB (DUF420 family)